MLQRIHPLRPGWRYEITPMTFGKARINLTDGVGVENGWCYDTMYVAMIALAAFDPESMAEPEGWYRNPHKGRRRPDDDPTREHIHW